MIMADKSDIFSDGIRTHGLPIRPALRSADHYTSAVYCILLYCIGLRVVSMLFRRYNSSESVDRVASDTIGLPYF